MLTTVHAAIQHAQDEPLFPIEGLEPCSFKVDPKVKDIAEEICIRHGITLSAFIRHCVTGLVRDYTTAQE